MSDEPGLGARQQSGEGPLPPAHTSGFARASYVCGQLGLVLALVAFILAMMPVGGVEALLGAALSGLTGLAGVILGIWAMVRITDNPLKRKGRGLALTGICFSAISLLIIPAYMVLIPVETVPRVQARKAACIGNLHNIGLGMALYANECDGELPPDLDALYPQYLVKLAVFDCPGRGKPRAIHPGIGRTGGYRYVGTLNPIADPGVIIAYDKAGNHAHGRNALFAGGRVEWIPEEKLPARLKESLELVKQSGWDQYLEERKREIEAFCTLEQTE